MLLVFKKRIVFIFLTILDKNILLSNFSSHKFIWQQFIL